jgi:hypothetical protein
MHRRIRSSAALALIAFATLTLWNGTSLAQVDCASVNMTVAATVSNDPGFVGLYKYTVSGTWDVGRRALSHLDVFFALENCVCVCDPRIFKFPATAGTSNGGTQSGSFCTVSYIGEYLCVGDPSIPDELHSATIKFEPGDGSCEPMTVGSGTWSFYSPFPPAAPQTYPNVVGIKHGLITCLGDLTGQLPVCDCSVPAQPTTWGFMKSIYR